MPIFISGFLWDDWNVAHTHERHGIEPTDVEEVLLNAPKFYPNKAGRRGSHQMIGPTYAGRFITAILEPTETARIWYPITAFPSSRQEVRKYEADEGGEE